MRLTGVEISNKPKNVQNKQEFRKLWKHCKSHIHTVRNVGNDDLKNVYHSQRISNFENNKMCKTNRYFENFENTVNLINTVCAMLEMII